MPTPQLPQTFHYHPDGVIYIVNGKQTYIETPNQFQDDLKGSKLTVMPKLPQSIRDFWIDKNGLSYATTQACMQVDISETGKSAKFYYPFIDSVAGLVSLQNARMVAAQKTQAEQIAKNADKTSTDPTLNTTTSIKTNSITNPSSQIETLTNTTIVPTVNLKATAVKNKNNKPNASFSKNKSSTKIKNR